MTTPPDALGIPGFREATIIGSGGFSTVYRAYQEEGDRWVAVKVLHNVDPLDSGALRRFTREGQAMGRLSDHPNVVTFYFAKVDDNGRPYIVSELCPGGSYADRIRDNGQLPIEEVLGVARKVGEALSEAHAADIIHRDIKPANILITRRAEPALADFGLSVRPQSETSRGLDAFSLVHAAPETITEGTYGPTSDLYSFGSTLYMMLLGRAPFPMKSGEPEWAYTTRKVQDEAPPLERADVPPELAALVLRTLAKDPSVRPKTVQELLRALPVRAAVYDEEPPTTVRASAAAPMLPTRGRDLEEPETTLRTGDAAPRKAAEATPSRSRRRVLLGTLLAVVASAVVGGAVAVVSGGSSPKQTPKASTGATLVLNRVVDQGTTALLSWTGPAGFQFAVDVAPTDGEAIRTVVGSVSSYQVSIKADKAYCFQVRGTDATTVVASAPVPLRGAQCSGASAATAPSVTVAKGQQRPAPSCSAPACASLIVTLAHFQPDTDVDVTCSASTGGAFYTYKAHTDAKGASRTEPCFYGYLGKQVWATAGGVRAASVTW